MGVLLISYYLFFGYFHFDGFLDVIDGFLVSRKTPEHRYAIMKDPHIGALTLLIQYQTTLHFSSNWFLFPIFGRAAMPWMLSVSKPFSKEGLAAGYYPYPRRYGLFSSIFFFPLYLYHPFWPACLVGVAVSLAVTAVLRWIFLRLMGGINGDVLSCVCIIKEVGFLPVNNPLI
jgi:adenosylcobinamide-GDP ribazoletransferase